MCSLPNTYKNQNYESKLLGENLLLLLYKHQILPHLKVEEIYYLDCLLSVLLKLDVQIGYNISRLTSILEKLFNSYLLGFFCFFLARIKLEVSFK